MKKKITIISIVAFLLICGIAGYPNSKKRSLEEGSSTEGTTVASETEITEGTSEEIVEEVSEEISSSTTEATTEDDKGSSGDADESVGKSTFAVEEVPEYAGTSYAIVNDNVPFFTEDEKKRTDAFETYSDLDELGRCGVAYANLCKDLMPTEERGEIGDIHPSGWHTVKYNDLVEGNYLYNRCHLIAYSLAGENDNEKNLITGTRYMNTEGMQAFEWKVSDCISGSDNHVLYRVTPIFEGNNLVASGVLMEAWSVEDDGESICFNVYCYNVQPGIEIDYLTGESWVEETTEDSASDRSFVVETTEEATEEKKTESTVDPDSYDYVVNTNSGKIHLPSCSSVDDMAEKNKWYYSGTIEELKEKGYEPCKNCLKGY